ncbi:MAG: mediator complex subunit [Trizodia sp. TS-e1964]|nr:MAG: mediator complex subunit [Trizodia sp. TS-e1964]
MDPQVMDTDPMDISRDDEPGADSGYGEGLPSPLSQVLTKPDFSDSFNGFEMGGVEGHEKLLQANTADSEMPDADPLPAVNPFRQLPQDIEHITQGYLQLSTLIQRLCQESLDALGGVINNMSEIEVAAPHTTNGRAPRLLDDGNSTKANVEKKGLLLNYAQTNRARFIEALVLARWSRHSVEISQAIDIKVWLNNLASNYEQCWSWIGEIKRRLGPAKLPNPDLKTAMVVLTTGKASWLPNFGYIPPDPLTPQQMLKSLQNINVLLAIRLGLHEGLPERFKRYTIASGRVTFSVPDEFEVDLSIGDKNPSSQFYFIDFRILFRPSAFEFPQGRFRDDMERKLNGILHKEGLHGCYKYFHEFVLTHKITILRHQLADLGRGKWADSLFSEMVHRTLIVQYWVEKPGAKSWLEIGIRSGRRKDKLRPLREHRGVSYIGIRWVREGKEVTDASISYNPAVLSIESILKNAIALHTRHILTAVYHNLAASPLYSKRGYLLRLKTSTYKPEKSSLRIQLTPTRFLTIVLEPASGRFIFQPGSLYFVRLEHEFNGLKNPLSDGDRPIKALRCRLVTEEIEDAARCIGWEPMKTLSVRKEELQRIMPEHTYNVSYFRRRGWSDNWVLAVSIGMGGEAWWVFELAESRIGHSIKSAHQVLVVQGVVRLADTLYSFLADLEFLAVSLISTYSNFTDLKHRKAQFELRPSPPSFINIPILHIRLSSLKLTSNKRPYWASDILSVTCDRVEKATSMVHFTGRARISSPIKGYGLIRPNLSDDVFFQLDTGTFVIKVVVAVGSSAIPELRERLLRIERLISIVEAMHQHNFKFLHLSLERLTFTYGPSLKMDIQLSHDHSTIVEFEDHNPHIRIQDFIGAHLNSGLGGVGQVATLLQQSLLLYTALDEIETKWEQGEVLILHRTADWLRMRYPDLLCTIDVRLRLHKTQVFWFFSYSIDKIDLTVHPYPKLRRALSGVMLMQGPGWRGLRNCVIANMSGAGTALKMLDRVMRDHYPDPAHLSSSAFLGHLSDFLPTGPPPFPHLMRRRQHPSNPDIIMVD